MPRILTLVVIAAFALAACGSGGGGRDVRACTDVLSLAKSVAGGLTQPGEIEDAGALRFDPVPSPVLAISELDWLVAGSVNDDIAVWAVSGDRTWIFNVNAHARAVSSWGIASPGQAQEGIDRIAELDQVDQLVACVEAGGPRRPDLPEN